ncbi:putative aspartyl/glutamyl-tRNA amidotransferase subunit C [Candidatus Ichthyocystis hellenicum]|uniref:Putative aspartyl/glutamyl-tRNA amidotransferase subunit C n=2 Tax=Burkholderiales genera incertae sedis TaxID=224471 RepID=A0A0S4M532_9BURK|nr:putative aspartyl/glutamyl-tRNA amidotransferase subunit C [Candidatus Ichthyocystis hellenicum]
MVVTDEDVYDLAAVSRISLSETDCQIFRDHLANIFLTIDELSRVECDGDTEPLIYPLGDGIEVRDDVSYVCDCSSQLGSKAPLFDKGLYLVPPVISKR